MIDLIARTATPSTPLPTYRHLLRAFQDVVRRNFSLNKGRLVLQDLLGLAADLTDLGVDLANDFSPKETGIDVACGVISHFFVAKFDVELNPEQLRTTVVQAVDAEDRTQLRKLLFVSLKHSPFPKSPRYFRIF